MGTKRIISVGDRVIMSDTSMCDEPGSPRWGGKHGHIAGTIIKQEQDTSQIVNVVHWDNGQHGRLYTFRLTRYTFEMMLRHKLGLLNSKTKKYQKYIGLIALAIVIDYFVLDGKIVGKFRLMAEKFVRNIISGLDVIVNKLEVSPPEIPSKFNNGR